MKTEFQEKKKKILSRHVPPLHLDQEVRELKKTPMEKDGGLFCPSFQF